MEATAASTPGANPINAHYDKFRDTLTNPDAKVADVTAAFEELLGTLEASAKKPGRDTDDLTPERMARIKKIVGELEDVILKNGMEHGIDKLNDVIALTAVTHFLRRIDKNLIRGFTQSLIIHLAKDEPGFDVVYA